MLKTLILASATAAVALTAAADFSAGTFSIISDAEARTSIEAAQTMKLKRTPAKPNRPTRKSLPGSSGPVAPGGLQGELLPDLYFDHYPTSAADAGGHFCSQEPDPNQKSKFAEVKVYSEGNQAVGIVEVRIFFLPVKHVHKRVVMNAPNAVKTVSVRIPDNAWINGMAAFNVLIDYDNKVAEDDESNNTTGGHCLDPDF